MTTSASGSRAALKHAASLGVTTIQDMTASATELRAYQALLAAGELTARIYSIQNHGIEGARQTGVTTGFGNDWIRIGGIKLFADGSMGSGTAAFFEPYADDPSTSGLLIQEPACAREGHVRRRRAPASSSSFTPLATARTRSSSTFWRSSCGRAGTRDRRPRIEHAQVVRDADKARFRKAGVIASIQPSHCIDDMRWAEKRIGKTRSAVAYDFKSFVDAGVQVAFGTDWYVEPLDPMLGLYAAVTRQFPDGTPPDGWFPEERLDLSRRPSSSTRSARRMPSSPRIARVRSRWASWQTSWSSRRTCFRYRRATS